MNTHSTNFRRRKKRAPISDQQRSGNKRPQKAKAKKQSKIDPNTLIKKASPPVQSKAEPRRPFSDIQLDHRLQALISEKGFENLTEIQDKTIEYLMEGHDLLGIAKTGTGKTGAFLIPLIHRLLEGKKHFQTLVLLPTRELALQVEEEFKSLTKGLGLHCASLIGGTNLNQDLRKLRRPNQLVIGTPGRTMDLIDRKALRLSSFSVLILDEFDRMLDMGFVKDVMDIAMKMDNRKQTMLFSATVNPKQQALINKLLHRPKEVLTTSGRGTSNHIDQNIVRISEGEDKFGVLLNLIRQKECEKVLVFAETKRWVSRLTVKLRKSGIRAEEIHGNKSQNYRNLALRKFRDGDVQVLTATDVAARGIDVDDITHVINYQLPMDMDSYIHRIGRTGRAGKMGIALTLIDPPPTA